MKGEKLVPSIGTGSAPVCPDWVKIGKPEEKKDGKTENTAIKKTVGSYGST